MTFTDEELKVIAIDYKSIISVGESMTRIIKGSKILEFNLDADDKVRGEIFSKVKKYLPEEYYPNPLKRKGNKI